MACMKDAGSWPCGTEIKDAGFWPCGTAIKDVGFWPCGEATRKADKGLWLLLWGKVVMDRRGTLGTGLAGHGSITGQKP